MKRNKRVSWKKIGERLAKSGFVTAIIPRGIHDCRGTYERQNGVL
jgi:hypothetical protein